MFSVACLQWLKWKIVVFPVRTKSFICVQRKAKCWDILHKLWKSWSGIRVCISPFWALSVSFNTRDRSYNLLLSQDKGHTRNCWTLCLLEVKPWVWKSWVATKGLDGLRMWSCGHSSLSMILPSPVHHVTPQSEEWCRREDKRPV